MESRDSSLAELWDRADQACPETRELIDDQRSITEEIKRKVADLFGPAAF
jgi:hypothetical protein